MAQITTIAEARGYGLLLKQLFGVEPSYYQASDHVKVYYDADKLPQVQARIASMAESGPADVRISWFPMIAPIAVKRAVPYIIGIAALGFLLGKAT